tara:strand:+ start:143 stop:550 length:408 start_codon:yes stop_codon:yes gene_type:complete
MKSLIKSKERVDNLGEVFTPEFIIEKMLNNIPSSYWKLNKSFLEPTCGTGNFLVEILKKKVFHGNSIIESLRSLYGIDIMEDNVIESRKRLFTTACSLGLKRVNWESAVAIIKFNIICCDISNVEFDDIWIEKNK